MDPARRKLCQAAGLALAGAALPACGGAKSCPEAPTMCSTAGVSFGLRGSDVALGQAVKAQTPEGNVFVCRDAGGLYVVDAACTHHGCDVGFVDAAHGFLCACHGATYDFNGQHPTAPAPTPLAHYALCTTLSGELVVDPGTTIDACVRYGG
jgi:Rieske Fe-S protein